MRGTSFTDPEIADGPAHLEGVLRAALKQVEEMPAALVSFGFTQLRWRLLLEEWARFGSRASYFRSVEAAYWAQMDVRTQDPGLRMKSFLHDGLFTELEELIRVKAIKSFFYVYKPPGIRFRIEVGSEDIASAMVFLAKWHSWARGEEYGVSGLSIYAPESPLLGVDEGLALTHKFFTDDSVAVCRFIKAFLGAENKDSFAPLEFSLRRLLIVLQAAVPDLNEHWSIWDRLAKQERAMSWGENILEQGQWMRSVNSILSGWTASCSNVSLEEVKLRELGNEARRQEAVGLFPCGIRTTLAYWVLFHWNRMGFGSAEQALICRAMASALAPSPVA